MKAWADWFFKNKDIDSIREEYLKDTTKGICWDTLMTISQVSFEETLKWIKKRMDDNLNAECREDIVDVYEMIDKELNNESI